MGSVIVCVDMVNYLEVALLLVGEWYFATYVGIVPYVVPNGTGPRRFFLTCRLDATPMEGIRKEQRTHNATGYSS